MKIFKDAFKGKKVLITGHTGFKGTWLSIWLTKLGAEVHGISDCIPTTPSMFQDTGVKLKSSQVDLDIRNFEALKKQVETIKPDYFFHLAAQAIVSESYRNPLETIQVNTLGFANVLEVLRTYPHELTAVLITSDKCYENVEQMWGYKETDQLGGKDIYSASKGAAEVLFHAYFHSFFKDKKNLKVATARAGNVIGGGDWAKDRIIPDAFRSWSTQKSLPMRSPQSTRPWQHVLEPLSGYLCLAQALYDGKLPTGESFNFGPRSMENHTVFDLVKKVWEKDSSLGINGFNPIEATPVKNFHEANLLKLNCEKAEQQLRWSANLTFDELTGMVSDWYTFYFKNKNNGSKILDKTLEQIRFYEEQAKQRKLCWCDHE